MSSQKLYAGVKLREIRRRFDLTQKAFAERLKVSLPYLNQMENNNRPISTGVVLALAKEFGFDVAVLGADESERLVSDMREALLDPVFSDMPPLADLKLAASNAPALSRSLLEIYRAYRTAREQLAAMDEALGAQHRVTGGTPWDEVRDFFHYCDNYIDAVDRAAEIFAQKAVRAQRNVFDFAEETLTNQGISVAFRDTDTLRRYDPTSRALTLSTRAPKATQRFQLLIQVALIAHDKLIDATLDLARFQTQEAQSIAKLGLANYFAGAALLPYQEFLTAAQETRHDLERLSNRFGASIEQISHRLSTMQRPGAKGVPFFFVRVDQAGTITKRHSATRLQFARFGGACPLWNVHQAFETPGRFLRQLAQTPDGMRYFCLARDVTKTSGSFREPVRRFAIGLGCEVKHAPQIIYADDLDVNSATGFEPIGISCRICERANCHQRSVPPLERELRVDPHHRQLLPYEITR